MKLSIPQNELQKGLARIQSIVEKRNTMPILANVLIEAAGDEVKLLATDLEVGLRSKCSASVAKGGSLTLPANLPSGMYHITPWVDPFGLVLEDTLAANTSAWSCRMPPRLALSS